MKRILLTLSYDGTEYHGWQVQPNGITVQAVLQNSLEKILKMRPSVTGCSRTDAGVHANEFCCHIDVDEKIPEEAFIFGLNSVLPKDIAVIGVKQVPEDFHARYSCKGKNYIYKIYNSNIKNPFSRYALQIQSPLNAVKMDEFCKKIIGTHNFEAFSSINRTVADTVRTISECSAERDGDMVYLSVSADGFLYNMVRIIVGTAIGVSYGKIDLDVIDEILISGDRSKTGITMPPNGLFLNKVFY